MRPGRVEIPSCSHDSRIKTVELGKDSVVQMSRFQKHWIYLSIERKPKAKGFPLFGQSMDQKEQQILPCAFTQNVIKLSI